MNQAETPRVRAVAPRSRLASDGGEPIIKKGFIARGRWPKVEPMDVERVLDQLRAGLLTEMAEPKLVHSLEAELAGLCAARYALLVNSGTSAIHCALAGVGVQPGDEVVVPALAYIGCAGAVLHHQGIPVFSDVDPESYNVTTETLEAVITPRTRAILVVHLHGLPCDMGPILELGRKHGVAVVEDFSQAVGASYRGEPVGSLGVAGAASLMAGKNLASGGEGGVLVTNDLELRNRAARLKCFAEEVLPDGSHRTLHATMGWNYRAGILAMVMASQQLFRLDEFNDRRRRNAARLSEAVARVEGMTPPREPEWARHVYHMYRFRFDPTRAGLSITADQAREALKRVFWEEGLPLVEFQNRPLSGHPLLQREVGYGRGCPWSCHGRDAMTYSIDDSPGALDAIRHTLVVGYPSQAPLFDDTLTSRYVEGFEKLANNMESLERIAASLPSVPPWEAAARLF